MNVPEDLRIETPLWRFAGHFWARPVAREAALVLQQQGWSVTDILCGLWLALQGQKFTGYGTSQVLIWRTRVTEALRNARKAITKGNKATDKTRDSIARSELDAEKIELALAYSALTGRLASPEAAPDTAQPEDIVKTLALENLQAAAPEKGMDNETGRLLESLIKDLLQLSEEESPSC